MQEPRRMAQGSGEQSSSLQTPSDERAGSVAVSSKPSGGTGDGSGQGFSFMVLLRRPVDQEQVGTDDASGNDIGSGTLHAERSGETKAPGLYIEELTPTEMTTILRRREGLGLDKSEIFAETIACFAPINKNMDLTQSEICFLLRRRLEKTQKACADEMGISRYWFNMMEQGKAPYKTLVEYWSRYAG